MGVPVILSTQSIEDLAGIVSFIAKDDPIRAESFGSELIDRAVRIGTFPEMGRQVPEFRSRSVREVVKSPYRIVYAVLDDPQESSSFASGTARAEHLNFQTNRSEPRL